MKNPVVDPVAGAMLDFQSVMAQFLDLQTEMLALQANRKPHVLAHAQAIATVPDALPSTQVPAAPLKTAELTPEMPAASVSAAPRETRPLQTAGEQAAFSRYTLSVRERPLSGQRAGLAAGASVVITDDGRGVASVIAESLRSVGRRVAVISPPGAPQIGGDLFVSALDSTEEADRVAREIAESCGPVAALIHLMPLSATDEFDALDAASWWDRLSGETRTLFLLTKSLAAALDTAARNGGAVVLAATSMGDAFAAGRAARSFLPSQGGPAGFLKCLAIEWPDVRVRAVDLDASETVDVLATRMIDELWAADATVEIGYVNGGRVGLDPLPTPASLQRGFDLPSDSVILATGGARGITAEVCLELAERYQPTFVLVGHSAPPPLTESADTAGLSAPADLKRVLMARLQGASVRVTPAIVEKAYRQLLKEREIRDVISRLSAAGARTHYVQLDVTDERAFGGLIDEIYDTYGRLDGVIHGAGLIEDKLVRDKPLDSFDRVFRTKTISAFVLSRRLKPETLRFLIFFSSVAGRFGNRGQADYAAANEVISKLAVLLQARWPGRVCAIAWAPWDKLGMVTPELKREFARRGVELLAPAAGRRALWQEIQQGRSAAAEVVIGGHAATPLAGEARSEPVPLMKHATRQASSVGTTQYVRHLDPAIDLYLNDHRLDGRPVLPLAFATEFMAEAAQAAWPDLRVAGVRDLQLLKGIVLDAQTVPIVITARSAAHSSDSGMTEVDVDISTPTARPSVRYRGVVLMTSTELAAPAFAPPAWPLVPLDRPLDRAYAEWTFHGPSFQRITAIAGIGVDSMLGSVFSSSAIPVLSGAGRPEWIIDPFVFDAALQMLLMWSRARHDKTALPSRFRSFVRYRSLSDQPLTCYVAVESLAGGHALRSHVHFVDAAGHVLAVLDAMEASCTAALNRLTTAESGTRTQ